MSQLKAVLWKNWLLKAANPKGTAAELLLPGEPEQEPESDVGSRPSHIDSAMRGIVS
jgi:hypothetical protein